MIAFLYQWRIKEGAEEQFREGWARRTTELARHGGLGSRLHRGDDGTWVAYARWPSVEARDAALELPVQDQDAVRMMREAIEESFPEVTLTIDVDLLAEPDEAE